MGRLEAIYWLPQHHMVSKYSYIVDNSTQINLILKLKVQPGLNVFIAPELHQSYFCNFFVIREDPFLDDVQYIWALPK